MWAAEPTTWRVVMPDVSILMRLRIGGTATSGVADCMKNTSAKGTWPRHFVTHLLDSCIEATVMRQSGTSLCMYTGILNAQYQWQAGAAIDGYNHGCLCNAWLRAESQSTSPISCRCVPRMPALCIAFSTIDSAQNIKAWLIVL